MSETGRPGSTEWKISSVEFADARIEGTPQLYLRYYQGGREWKQVPFEDIKLISIGEGKGQVRLRNGQLLTDVRWFDALVCGKEDREGKVCTGTLTVRRGRGNEAALPALVPPTNGQAEYLYFRTGQELAAHYAELTRKLEAELDQFVKTAPVGSVLECWSSPRTGVVSDFDALHCNKENPYSPPSKTANMPQWRQLGWRLESVRPGINRVNNPEHVGVFLRKVRK